MVKTDAVLLRFFLRGLRRGRDGVRSAGGGVVEKFVKVSDFAVLDRDDVRETRRVLFIRLFRAGGKIS